MKIVITGASGLIGSAIISSLEPERQVIRMVRSRTPAANEIPWNPGETLDAALLADVDAVIHLAGRNIGVRWTETAKREIVASRVKGTRTISQAVAESFRRTGKPNVLISASAIGYYGSREDERLTEASASGTGFLAEVGRAWEEAASAAREAGVRTVFPRMGVVLSRSGGALARMLPPFRLGLGGPIGSGRQWMSWIALNDVVGGMRHLLRWENLNGAVNLVAPNPVTNAEFTRALGKALHRPAVIPVPAFAIKLALGEMGDELLLSSTRVLPKKLEESGYKFRYPRVDGALEELVAR